MTSGSSFEDCGRVEKSFLMKNVSLLNKLKEKKSFVKMFFFILFKIKLKIKAIPQRPFHSGLIWGTTWTKKNLVIFFFNFDFRTKLS